MTEKNPWLAEPAAPAGTPDCKEFKVLRQLRTRAKSLLEYGAHAALMTSLLEKAIYPVGSRVNDEILTTAEKDRHRRLLPDSLDMLARTEAAVLQCSLDISAARKELALLELKRAHKELEREVGGIADVDEEDELS